MSTVLGIDLGTQSVKAVCYDAGRRKTIALGSAPLALRQDAAGTAEQEAAWWLDATVAALAGIPDDVRRRIAAVSVSGQQHGFVAVDGDGEVVAPVKLWCDTSTGAQCAAIMARFGGAAACISELGNAILPGYTASKIAWLRDKHPDRYCRMRHIMLPHDYLNYRLTGEPRMEAGDASGTGLLDVRRRTWSEKMLRCVDPDRDLRACLPDVRTDGGAIGTVSAAAAGRFGLPAGIPVAAGGGDNMMAAIGSGNVTDGVVTMSLGTSGTLYAYSRRPVVDPAGDIAAAAPGAQGVVTVPFFNGERTPNLPSARACVFGLHPGNTLPGNLLRATVEGATFALRSGLQRLRDFGIEAAQIVLTGGGSNSATWRQIVADVCATPVTTLRHDEGAAHGAALQALAMLRNESDMTAVTATHVEMDDNRRCDPRPAASTRYDEVYSEYQRAVDRVASMYQRSL